MLRNSSELFVHQCAKGKFLDTLEDVLNSQRTSPVVRERLLDVLAAAAYASSGTSYKNESSFRTLWRKVKPAGKPDEVGLCSPYAGLFEITAIFFDRVCPSILMMPCSTPLRHGEAPQLASLLLLVILPCIPNYFKPRHRRILSHRLRHNRNHNRHSHRPKPKQHPNHLPGRSARRRAMDNYSGSYRPKRICGDCSKNVSLRTAMRRYSLKLWHSPLRRT